MIRSRSRVSPITMAQLPFGGQKSPYKHGHIKELLGLRPCLRERSPNHICAGGCTMAEVEVNREDRRVTYERFPLQSLSSIRSGLRQEDQMWKGEIYGKR